MQAEHSRGNGFIVSPLSIPSKAGKQKKRFNLPKLKLHLSIGEYISGFLALVRGEWKYVKRVILKALVSLLLVIGCIFFFCNFFTVGTAIYKGNKLVAYSASEREYNNALSSASKFAQEQTSKGDYLHFKIIPALTLRSNVLTSVSLRDKLLESTGKFRYGCTLYSEGTAIFTAESEKVAREIVNNYIASYSMNGQASADAKLSYKVTLLPVSEISDRDKCLALLSESGNVPVVSVVSVSQEKEIPFETQTQYDDSLYIGESVTVTEGKTGSSMVESQTIYKNGEFESSQVVTENVVSMPVTQVVRVGTKPKDVLTSGLLYPLTGTLSSPFGERWGRMHEGIDIAVPVGTSVKAAECGTVIFAGVGGGYGNLVKIDHGNGIVTAYAHLDKINVSKGQTVDSNTEIAKSGNTGRSTGPHLHFEVLKNGTPLNPMTYLKKR